MYLKLIKFMKFKNSTCLTCTSMIQKCRFSQELESKYNEEQKQKILDVVNNSDSIDLSGFNITQGRLKKIFQWKSSNGTMKSISDVELIDGFSEKTAKKLFDSILDGPANKASSPVKIRGQILHPHLSEIVRQRCESVLTVYIAVNSVCWALINKSNYEVTEWMYHGIDYREGKRLQITDILDIAWEVTHKLPTADIYVMKAEATTLRAAGSDPNNPKVLAVNLQKSQMVAMMVALINARSYEDSDNEEKNESKDEFNHKVYFLRPTLPYRLYGTLVGNEKVSTDQTVEMLLQNAYGKSTSNSHMCMSERLKNMFRSQKDLQKDMLGHCLLLALTFMDVCIYKNQESINKLMKREIVEVK